MSYMALKHTHLLFIIISVGLFVLRFAAREAHARFVQAKIFKIAPHIIDTCLLLSGFALMFTVGYSIWPINWLSVKLLLVVAYIVTGIIAMKATSKAKRWSAAIVALIWIAAIAHLAISKSF
jgi:uncharacterized membrane protein SirB2